MARAVGFAKIVVTTTADIANINDIPFTWRSSDPPGYLFSRHSFRY
jgi:hypothetical protein